MQHTIKNPSLHVSFYLDDYRYEEDRKFPLFEDNIMKDAGYYKTLDMYLFNLQYLVNHKQAFTKYIQSRLHYFSSEWNYKEVDCWFPVCIALYEKNSNVKMVFLTDAGCPGWINKTLLNFKCKLTKNLQNYEDNYIIKHLNKDDIEISQKNYNEKVSPVYIIKKEFLFKQVQHIQREIDQLQYFYNEMSSGYIEPENLAPNFN